MFGKVSWGYGHGIKKSLHLARSFVNIIFTFSLICHFVIL